MKVQTAERLNHVGEYYFSTKLGQIREMIGQGKDIINLGVGNPDMSPHSSVIEVLTRESMTVDSHGYQSYRSIPELRQAFSKWYKRIFDVKLNPETEILPLIGSKEGIMHISMTFLNRGDAVLVPDPGYPAYAAASKLCGARLKYYNLGPENNWFPDIDELKKQDLDGVKLMWINYPNMPSGSRATKDNFLKLASFTSSRNILLINDNPYGLIQNPEPLSLFSTEVCRDNIIELNSLSKSHNMAGWRIGMVASSEDNISSILKVKSNIDSGMFLPLQKAAARALELPDEWYDELNHVYASRRRKVFELLSELGSEFSNDQSGMFVWSRLPSGRNSSYEYSDLLLEKYGIFITPGSLFGTNGRSYLRTSLCVAEDRIKECIKRVRNIPLAPFKGGTWE